MSLVFYYAPWSSATTCLWALEELGIPCEKVKVDLVLDTAPREVDVPKDLAAALQKVPNARTAFDAMAYSHRKEWVRSVEEAKKPETRQRRIDKCIEALRDAAR